MAAAGVSPALGAQTWADAASVPTTFPTATMTADSLGWVSSNWAGYFVDHGPYTNVAGQWRVPTVLPTAAPTFSALWIGIDGATNQSLIQVGTEQAFYGGRAHYLAWWEILPAPAVAIPTIPIRPGDVMSARIMEVSAGQWRITIVDRTRGRSTTTTRRYDGPGSSAEWIEEAPLVDGQLPPLAYHGTALFDNATANGANPHLMPVDAGAMVNFFGAPLELPSAPDADGNGFALSEAGVFPSAPGT